jgi:hypothetical protein
VASRGSRAAGDLGVDAGDRSNRSSLSEKPTNPAVSAQTEPQRSLLGS